MRFLLTMLAAVIGLAAAEYRGEVTFGGLPLPGVSITATQGDRTLATSTGERGEYSFADLPAGKWSLHVQKLGFAPVTQEIDPGAGLPAAAIDLTMLALDEIEAPAHKRPAAGQPFQTAVAPAITNELTARAEDGLLINGSAVNGAITQTAQASSFGNARRNGKPLYHFALALVDSNSVLNAANYSLTGQRTMKPPFDNMTGTASLAGPIRIPHLTNGDRSLFSVTYSRIENRSSSVYTGLIPTADERPGAVAQRIVDPLNGQPFAGNVIPANRISRQAVALLKYYPLPNFDGGSRYNYQVPLIANTHTDNLQAGGIKSFHQRNSINGGITLMDTRGDSNSQFNFLDRNRSFGINANAAYRRTFTSRFYGTLSFTFSRFSSSIPSSLIARTYLAWRESPGINRRRSTGVRRRCNSLRAR